MDGNREEVEKWKGSKRPLQESNTDNADSVPLVKKRKELKESVKTQKAAAIATANEMAKQIFQERNINSSETEKQQHLREIKQLTDKVKELNEKLEDKQSSIEDKRVVVSNLEKKVEELKKENMELRCELDRSKHNTHNTTGKCIGDIWF